MLDLQRTAPTGLYPAGDHRQRAGGAVAAKRQRGRGNINHRGSAMGDDICHAVLLLAAGCDLKAGAEISRRLSAAAEGDIPGY